MDLGPENKYYIKCTGLPVALLNKTAAKDHFSKFGKIMSIHLRTKARGCRVEYADEDSLRCALINAGKYNGQNFVVTRGVKSTRKVVKKELWKPDLEVQHELDAMSGIGVYKLGAAGIKPKAKKLSKNLWVKSAKSSEQQNISNTSVSTEQRELLKIIKQSAQTVEERFRILDARDKLIRLRTQKHADLDTKSTVGTCPDMCPEKERLMREIQHQVALYEQEPTTKTLNPCLAVKQYSRSSADQEASLPYELRPVNVLQMTMGYLVHKIIPLCDNPEVNLAEWYHFLWDRTRGIRKDITQQELCCHGSVQLVEQCARYHIHCSARLVAEDPSVFDHRINTENLTKCLQTLKYMYHDLRCKNESCPKEAEFRGYIILLNLNDGNFMWEVQQLRDEIQKSEQVQFALKVYSALDKNNYVKFFKLVKSTTYLNACILLRYFIQVRVRAVQTILKSFSPRGLTQFPLDELRDILAFEGGASARDFVEYYGLYMNDTGSHICLDRSSFNIPVLPYMLDRAISVVESKRTLSIGEIICGGELPLKIFETHQPHSSFDNSGFIDINEHFADSDLSFLQSVDDEKLDDKQVFALKKTDSRSNSPFDTVDSSEMKIKRSLFTKSEKSQDSIFALKPQPESIFGKKSTQHSIFGEARHVESLPQFPSDPPQFGLTVFKQNPTSNFGQPNKSIFAQTVESKPKPVAIFGQNFQQQSIFSKPTVFGNVQTAETTSNTFSTKPKKGGFSFNLAPTKQTNLDENRILELQKREEEIIRQNLLDQKLQIELVQKEQERKRLEIERQRRKELEKEKQRKRLEQQVIERRIEEAKFLEQQIEKRKLENERKLQLQKQLELQQKLERERQRLEEHKKMQEIRKNVSALVKDLLNRVEEKNRNDRLKEIKEKIVNRKIKYFVTKWRNNIVLEKRKRKAIDDWPIWVSSTSPKQQASELIQNNQKVVLMDMKRYKIGQATTIDVHNKLDLKRIDLDDVIAELLKNHLVKNHIFWKVDICFPTVNESKSNLKKIEEYSRGLLNFNSTTNSLIATVKFLGKTITYCIKKHDKFYKDEATDGFIFISDVFTEQFYLNIKQTIENHKSYVPLPIALILSNPDCNEEKLHELIEYNLVSNYAISYGDFTPNSLGSLLKNAMVMLTKNFPEQPNVELANFRSFLTNYLVGETWERINSFAEHNRPYGMCLTQPNTVFYLYRETLTRLQKIIFDKDLLKRKDFPKVFHQHFNEKTPTSLPCDWKYFPAFWRNESYNRKLHRVFDTLKLPDDIHINWPPKDVVELEDAVYDICGKFKCPDESAFTIVSAIIQKLEYLGDFTHIKYMMWTDVMKMLTIEKLKTIDFTLREPFVSESVFDELFVIYDARNLEKFNAEYWFYTDASIQEAMDCNEIIIEESEEETIREDDFDLERTLNEVTIDDFERDEILLKSKSQMKELRDMLDDLEESMDIQKKISGKFEETLTSALNNC